MSTLSSSVMRRGIPHTHASGQHVQTGRERQAKTNVHWQEYRRWEDRYRTRGVHSRWCLTLGKEGSENRKNQECRWRKENSLLGKCKENREKACCQVRKTIIDTSLLCLRYSGAEALQQQRGGQITRGEGSRQTLSSCCGHCK